jgi:hypothetical protein
MQPLIARICFAHGTHDAADQARDVSEPFPRQALCNCVLDPRDGILLDRLQKLILTAKTACATLCNSKYTGESAVPDAGGYKAESLSGPEYLGVLRVWVQFSRQ